MSSSNDLSILHQHPFLSRTTASQNSLQISTTSQQNSLQIFPSPVESVALHEHLHQQQDQEQDEQVSSSRTIVATDDDVSNGFVKDGSRLPYVFEATETGNKKKASKILPVCGVCGKRFVCVTTMKRHLVTHTGEKPFACKICGKQYTQKGNLRVHERTHRNDRPFECNICHQKFYRKEPMQKHQWRQHGIVHFKAQPPPHCTPSAHNTTGPQPQQQQQQPQPPQPEPISVVTSFRANSSNNNNKLLYSSIVDHLKSSSLETHLESSRHLDSRHLQQQQQQQHEPAPVYPSKVCSIVTAALDMSSTSEHNPNGDALAPNSSSSSVSTTGEFEYAKSSTNATANLIVSDETQTANKNDNDKDLDEPLPLTTNDKNTASPLKLKKVLADAYRKEVEQMDNPDQGDSSQPLDLSQTRPKTHDNSQLSSLSQSLTSFSSQTDSSTDKLIRRNYETDNPDLTLTKRPRPDSKQTHDGDPSVRHTTLPPISGLTRPVTTQLTTAKGLVPPWITITKTTKSDNYVPTDRVTMTKHLPDQRQHDHQRSLTIMTTADRLRQLDARTV